MRLEVLFLCFVTFCYNKNLLKKILLQEQLEDIIRGVAVSDNEGSSIHVDDDHKKRNPECGYLPEKPANPSATSRISNAKEAQAQL